MSPQPRPVTRRRRRPRLLGPEPRPQLRRAARRRAALVLRRARRACASGSRASSAGRASPPTSTTCSPTPTLDAVVLATPGADATPSWPSACSRRASTASSRSRSRSRSPTPSAPSRPQRRPAGCSWSATCSQYHPGVNKLKEIADSGELGDIHYIYGNRLNLGQLRADENALWSLGAHDVSVLLHLADEEPYELSARGESLHARRASRTSCSRFLRFPSGLAAHLHLSWLDPHKERRFTVVGSQADGDVRRHGPRAQGHRLRQGLRREAPSTYGEYITRSGDIWSPRVPNAEPLRLECEHFVDCVRDGRDADLRRRERPAGRPRPRGPAGLAQPPRTRGSRRHQPGPQRPRPPQPERGPAMGASQHSRDPAPDAPCCSSVLPAELVNAGDGCSAVGGGVRADGVMKRILDDRARSRWPELGHTRLCVPSPCRGCRRTSRPSRSSGGCGAG